MSKRRWDLVIENENLVTITLKSMSKKLSYINNDLDDYREAATWALINSARKYDFNRNVKFTTYALTSIRREVIHKYKINLQTKKRFKEQNISREDDQSTLEPYVSETNILDNMIYDEELVEVKNVFRNLPEKYRKIISMRFSEGKTFEEIGDEFDVTREMARVYYKKALSLIENKLVT